MAKEILLVNKDDIFNDLLHDILAQAKYKVTSTEDLSTLESLLENTYFDLIIIDQDLHEAKTLTHLNELKKNYPKTKIILISDIVEHKHAKDLTSIGIYSILTKPINILSLTKKVLSLLKNTRAPINTTDNTNKDNLIKLKSYPGKSYKSKTFLNKLQSANTFETTLIVKGSEGLPFIRIEKDLESIITKSSNAKFIRVKSPLHNYNDLVDLIKLNTDSQKNLILYLSITDLLKLPNPEILNELTNRKFISNNPEIEIKVIFCMDNNSIQTILKRYKLRIDKEIIAPSLNDCREDIPLIADDIYFDLTQAKNTNIPTDCLEYLKDQNWLYNNKQLKGVILNVLETASNNKNLYIKDFKNSYNNYIFNEILKPVDMIFNDTISIYKEDYIKAVYNLSQQNKQNTNKILQTNQDILNLVLS